MIEISAALLAKLVSIVVVVFVGYSIDWQYLGWKGWAVFALLVVFILAFRIKRD